MGHFAAFHFSLTISAWLKEIGEPKMSVLKFISKMTNELFERQMSRAAIRISAREHRFWHQAV
jgi:hypothetical protein